MVTIDERERRTKYDARGLSEPHAEIPKVSDIKDGRASFDATGLSTREINLELRWLLYEEGIGDITLRNPAAKHSLAVGLLRRCNLRIEGSTALFDI